MSKNIFNTTQFLASVGSVEQLQDARCEAAFVGRSNVGKSSLINALCGRRMLALVSKNPGKTRTINVFSVRAGAWIVDLPGYGFAAVSKGEKLSWKEMIESYLTSRRSLKVLFVLVDAYVGATDLDLQMFEWLKSIGIPYRVVVNKIDRVSQARLAEQCKSLVWELDIPLDQIICVSAKKNTGIRELHAVVAGFLGVR